MTRPSPRIPTSGPARESLREKGQFWTPNWVAQVMVSYLLCTDTDHVFDPAVGAGAFFIATKALANQLGRKIRLLGMEIDPESLVKEIDSGLMGEEIKDVILGDFILNPPSDIYEAIVANPPYLRHHRLSVEYKEKFRTIARGTIGRPLDGRAGAHVYFLLTALRLLKKDGRLAFIMPADTCEGVFSRDLWDWIGKNYRIDAVITFSHAATPFVGVDVNPVIFLIRNTNPGQYLHWVRCDVPASSQLLDWVQNEFPATGCDELEIHDRSLSEALTTGLSRPPREDIPPETNLWHYARTSRGIATGANDFFLLTRKRARELEIPDIFLRDVVARTRDVPGEVITQETLDDLERGGRPTKLFYPDGRPLAEFPPAVREYILEGERIGVHRNTLISTRKPWYKMEVREVPPILFAYLGRRNCRFIRNEAHVLPLTGFLCVYPRTNDPVQVERLLLVLNHPATLDNLSLVGKSYGSGAIKVEPRALERLPIPDSVISGVGLDLAV